VGENAVDEAREAVRCKCHRFVLAARAPLFAAEHEHFPKASVDVELDDADLVPVFPRFLEFVYKDELKAERRDVPELMQYVRTMTALQMDKKEGSVTFKRLFSYVEENAGSVQVTDGNCLALLGSSISLGMADLEGRALRHFAKNYRRLRPVVLRMKKSLVVKVLDVVYDATSYAAAESRRLH